MIRTTVPTSVRTGTALLGVAGLFVLAGCSSTGDAADTSTGTDETAGSSSSSSSSGGDASGTYTDGTYTADGSYQTPETVEEITVTLTLADGVVTEVE